jgi:diguanylate cyclase (GGDEF)-like protein
MTRFGADKTAAAFVAVTLLLAIDAVVMYRSIVQVSQAQAPTVAGLELLREINVVRTSLVDAETGQRGYVITGDPAYLEPYYNAITTLKRGLALLQGKMSHDARHSGELARLSPLLIAEVNALNRTIDLRRTRGFTAAQQVIETGEAKKTMDAFRSLVAELEQSVDADLVEDSRRAALSSRTTLVTFGIGALLMLALLSALIRTVMRDVLQRRRAELALKETNDRLEAGVAALEQRNQQVTLLSEMSGALQSCMTIEESFVVVGRFCQRLFPDSDGALYVMHASRNYLDAAIAWGESHHGASVFGPDDCWALRRSEPYLVLMPQQELSCKHVHADRTSPYLCVPLQAQGEPLGLLYLEFPPGEKADSDYFRRTRQLALGAGKQVALALANIGLRDTLRRQSVRDPLTGLFNRRYLEESLEREIARSERSGKLFCVVMIDVDHFKQFNDVYGHEAGDMVLRELGALLRSQTRGTDTACRYGGEEFTLILGDSRIDGALQRCERLCGTMRGASLSYRNQSLGVITISMGVAEYPQHGQTTEDLLRTADRALYRAKRDGRDRVVIAVDADAGAEPSEAG